MTSPVVSPKSERDVDRLARIEREKAIIARAERDIDLGLGIDDDDLERWLDALDEDENVPLPAPRSRLTLS